MSIIQRIREKGAVISVVVIALALLGFIAMDAFTGRSRLFGGGPSNTVGSVNGQRIDFNEFNRMVDITEQNLAADMASQGRSGEELRQQAIANVWDQLVNKLLLEQELDKLGLTISKKEMSELLYGVNPSPIARQYMGGQDGSYNPDQVRQTIRQIEKGRNEEQKQQLAQLLKYIEQDRLREKYLSLVNNSINVPKWKVEKQNADNSQMATISYVVKPYTDIVDSTVKVTDAEISDYINKHKDLFKQQESRGISYVSFSAAPSAADTLEVRNRMIELKSQLQNTDDLVRFLASEGTNNYYDGYISGKTIQIPNKDSIFKTPVGQVYGPYLDGTHFTLAKMVGTRQLPDSAKVRHILIATTQRDPQTGQTVQVRDSASARKVIDSVQNLIQRGENFDSVCAKLSEDPGSKDKGGVYEIYTGQMVPEFNDFAFTNPVGSKGIVKTDFGFHYMEVLSQKGSSPAYKVAYLSKPILVSATTDADASSLASQFAGKARDEKSFNETFEKELRSKGYNKGIGYDIGPNSYTIMGVGVSRELVRNIYEAKRGEVLQPIKVGNNYIVAVVTEVNKEGTQSVARARPSIEPALRNKKKAEMIKKQIGAVTTLEAAATAMGKTIQVADSLRITGGKSLGYEPRVSGAAFNPANRGKVVPEAIEGQAGVYVVRVDNVMAVATIDAPVEEQRKSQIMQAKQQTMYSPLGPLEWLRQAAKIKDNRAKRY